MDWSPRVLRMEGAGGELQLDGGHNANRPRGGGATPGGRVVDGTPQPRETGGVMYPSEHSVGIIH